MARAAALRLEMAPGDLLSLEGGSLGLTVDIVAFDDGAPALDHLGLAADGALDRASFDSAPLLGWIAAHGGKAGSDIPRLRAAIPAEPLILRTQRRVSGGSASG